MKKLFYMPALFSAIILFADAGAIPPIGWEAEGYQYNMTFYAQVLRLDNSLIEADESVLAAFDAYGECRGMITPIDGPNGKLFQMSIASNSVSEPSLTLKVLDAVTGETYSIAETVDFVNDAQMPEDGIVNPMQIHVRAPYHLQSSLTVSWSGISKQERLVFGFDEEVSESYSATKDILADETANAFFLSQSSSGEQLKLQQSIVKSSTVNQWQISIKVNAEDSATITWPGIQTDGQVVFLRKPDSSLEVVKLSEKTSLEINNSDDTEKTFVMTMIVANEETFALYDCLPGWNLLSIPFVPSDEDQKGIMKFCLYQKQGDAYSLAKKVEANVGYWLHCPSATCLAFECQTFAKNTEITQDWQLIGVSQEETVFSDEIHAWKWENGRFLKAKTLFPKIGYFALKSSFSN